MAGAPVRYHAASQRGTARWPLPCLMPEKTGDGHRAVPRWGAVHPKEELVNSLALALPVIKFNLKTNVETRMASGTLMIQKYESATLLLCLKLYPKAGHRAVPRWDAVRPKGLRHPNWTEKRVL